MPSKNPKTIHPPGRVVTNSAAARRVARLCARRTVREVHQRQVRRAAIRVNSKSRAGASLAESVALKGNPEIGHLINKRVPGLLAQANS